MNWLTFLYRLFAPSRSVQLLFLFSLICFSCKEEENNNKDGSAMLVKEIQLRLAEFEKLNDSLEVKGIYPEKIHSRFQELLLMSKDVENLQASVNMHNALLNEVCNLHQLNRSQLLEINNGMDLEQIDLIFKQNELQIFNQIWMQKLMGSIQLESVK